MLDKVNVCSAASWEGSGVGQGHDGMCLRLRKFLDQSEKDLTV